MPYAPKGDDVGHEYEVVTVSEKRVSDYTGLNFFQLQNLDIYDYLLFQRDAFIFNLSQTDAGREYLETAWTLEQTKPDKAKLRKYFS